MTSDPDVKFWALRELPPFPAIATKLLRLFADDDVEIREVVNLIRADTAFSSELLRVANSPIYGLRSQVSSVQHAVVILGFDRMRSFAMTISMKNFLRTAMRIDVLRRVWRHSLACALVAEELAPLFWRNGDRTSRDRAYTAGLLHNLGRLALLVKYPQEYANLLAVVSENPFDVLETERELFDVDHCEAGGWLAKAWTFPPEIAEVAVSHHEPPVKGEADLTNLVRSAVLLTDWLGFDVTPLLPLKTAAELEAMLPESACAFLEADMSPRKRLIVQKLDSFD
ncbi:MAG: HDOD domain-containing protein [Bryobacterales bacterium]|nr:HDOD domain-containing protein [Bryobacterales bacterium]